MQRLCRTQAMPGRLKRTAICPTARGHCKGQACASMISAHTSRRNTQCTQDSCRVRRRNSRWRTTPQKQSVDQMSLACSVLLRHI